MTPSANPWSANPLLRARLRRLRGCVAEQRLRLLLQPLYQNITNPYSMPYSVPTTFVFLLQLIPNLKETRLYVCVNIGSILITNERNTKQHQWSAAHQPCNTKHNWVQHTNIAVGKECRRTGEQESRGGGGGGGGRYLKTSTDQRWSSSCSCSAAAAAARFAAWGL